MYDLHTHSFASFDGNNSVEELCERALGLGLSGLAITDHIDQVATPRLFPEFTPDKLAQTAKSSYEQTSLAAEKYAGKMEILRGVELGQALHNRELSEFILHTYDYDLVLGSIHNLRATEDFYFMKYESAQQANALLHEYFEELYALVEWGQFDSLAHLSYPLRYMVGRDKINISLADFAAEIDAILALLAKKGLALELNCSGLRQEIGDTLPGEDIVRRFRELGGEYVTLGSDAHRLEHLALGLDKGVESLRRCGFNSLTVFRARKPHKLPFGDWNGEVWNTP
ncbi:MAG: histidinol-phosphatase HisJ family protein [Clostridium sp.]|nr:histidinol-phosphatase HisJ family protein [Clostridium sp.]